MSFVRVVTSSQITFSASDSGKVQEDSDTNLIDFTDDAVVCLQRFRHARGGS